MRLSLGAVWQLLEILACPVEGEHLPLVVVSHGYHGWYGNLHDVAETLADAGFVVAAINHPADTGPDCGGSGFLDSGIS